MNSNTFKFLLAPALALSAVGASHQALAADIVECTCAVELWSRNDWGRAGKASTYILTVDGNVVINQHGWSPGGEVNVPEKIADGSSIRRYFLGACPATEMSPWAFIHAPLEGWRYEPLNAEVSVLPHVKYSNGAFQFVWSGHAVPLPGYAAALGDDVKRAWIARLNTEHNIDINSILLEDLNARLQQSIEALSALSARISNLPQELVTEDLRQSLTTALSALSNRQYEAAKALIDDLEQRVTLLEGQG